jgi:V/A-type H+-transporting ATPase subunit E
MERTMGLEGSRGLEAVIKEIREKGRREAEAIRAETRAEVEEILQDAQNRAAEIKMAAEAEADRAATHIINQEVSAANLVVKRQVLNAQKTLLDQVYSASLAAVGDLPAEFHREALTELLKKVAGEIEEGVIHANAGILRSSRRSSLGKRPYRATLQVHRLRYPEVSSLRVQMAS